jgi:hypothetical protein
VAIDPWSGELDTGFSPSLHIPADGDAAVSEAGVRAIARVGRQLYVAGRVPGADGSMFGRLLAVDALTGIRDPRFRPTHLDASFLAPIGNILYAGGEYLTPNSDFALLTATTGHLHHSGPQVDGTVCASARIGRRLYIGGNFQTIDGRRQPNLAVLRLPQGSG